VDVSVPEGSEVHAAGTGRVRRASEDALNGKILIVDHGYGVSTVYCHNSKLLAQEGEVVLQGQPLALSGATGEVTGPHLHYQIELSDVAVDPLRFRRRFEGNSPALLGVE
jgi:murein DD-endopeptidase MepM/ murein hydrolase activator NlpD